MTATINWGIVGSGWVAGDFAQGLLHVPGARLAAVCARKGAPDFAKRHSVARSYTKVAELVADPEIDIVYIATPNHLHAGQSCAALEAGKPVLCEKPFAMNAAEARQVIALARSRSLFCMEAMWMRFLPAMQRVRELLVAGAVGDVRMVSANFGFAPPVRSR